MKPGAVHFGDAQYYGGGNQYLNCTCFVAMAPTWTGDGYWLTTNSGAIYTFGDAPYQGGEVYGTAVDMTALPNDWGYAIVNASGQVYTFGNQGYYGGLNGGVTATSIRNARIAGGYWILTTSGSVSAFGAAPYYGSAATSFAQKLSHQTTGPGYLFVDGSGNVFTFSFPNLGHGNTSAPYTDVWAVCAC